MKNLCLFILLFCHYIIQAQPNLVPNGSFEESRNDTCLRSNYWSTLQHYPPWRGIHYGINHFTQRLPDPNEQFAIIASTCSGSNCEGYCPGCTNCWKGKGLPMPYHGHNYAIFTNMNFDRSYHPIYPNGQFAGVSLLIRLKQPLKKDHRYSISYFVGLVEAEYTASNCFDVYFSKDSIYYPYVDSAFVGLPPFGYMYVHQPITNTGHNFWQGGHPAQVRYTGARLEPGGWYKLTADFVAQGGEEFMWMGCFRDSLSFDWYHSEAPNHRRGMVTTIFLDSVTVREWVNQRANEQRVPTFVTATPVNPIDTTNPPPPPPPFEIPNVITPNGDGVNDYWVIDGLPEGSAVVLHNRWGNTVFSEAPYRHRFNAEGLEAGTYFYLITEPNGTFHKGPLRVIKE